MYKLLHNGEALGSTLFESADPESHSLSGRFNNMGGAIALSAWIMTNGGTEDGEVIYLEVGSDFALVNKEGEKVDFNEATLIAVPGENEAYIELIIDDQKAYEAFLAGHVAALEGESA